MWQVSELEQRINEILDRATAAGDDHAKRAAALEECLQLARARDDADEWFEITAFWSEELAESYLALGRVEDAIQTIRTAAREGHGDGAEMLCDLAETLMRSGREPQARPLWEEARADFPDDIWTYVQAGIEYGDIGDHATALAWLTPGMELALQTGDPESALEQLVPLRSSCLFALGHKPDDLQARAASAQAKALAQAKQQATS
jgi:tetratricopeptide (TPR) repeat protein